MSNVLIGMIGVILFIGLALAGALILGDDFKSANVGSKSAKYIARMQQISAAAQMYQMKTGTKIGAERNGSVDWLTPRFLKSVPVDSGASAPAMYYYSAMAIYSYLPNTSEGLAICLEIQRSMGQIGQTDPLLTTFDLGQAIVKWPIGCTVHGGNYTLFAAV